MLKVSKVLKVLKVPKDPKDPKDLKVPKAPIPQIIALSVPPWRQPRGLMSRAAISRYFSQSEDDFCWPASSSEALSKSSYRPSHWTSLAI